MAPSELQSDPSSPGSSPVTSPSSTSLSYDPSSCAGRGLLEFPDIRHGACWLPNPTGSHYYSFARGGGLRRADLFYVPGDGAPETVHVTFIPAAHGGSFDGDRPIARHGSKLVVICDVADGTEPRDILHRIPEYRIVDFQLLGLVGAGSQTALAYFATESEADEFAARFQDAEVCTYRLGNGVRGPAFLAPSVTRPYSGDLASAIACNLPRTINWGVPLALAPDMFELLRILGLDRHVVDAWALSGAGGIFVEFDSPGRVWKLNKEMNFCSLRHYLFPEELRRFYRDINVCESGDTEFAALNLREKHRDDILDVYGLFKKGELEEIRHWGTPSFDYRALYDELWETSNYLPILSVPRE